MAARTSGKPIKQSKKFKEANKKVQFGAPGGNKRFNPKERGYHPMNLRAAQRYLASQEINPRDPKALDELMGHHKLTIAETVAFKQLQKAMAGDNFSIAAVTDNLCGKLADHHIIEEKKKRVLGRKSLTIEEANAALDEALKGEQ